MQADENIAARNAKMLARRDLLKAATAAAAGAAIGGEAAWGNAASQPAGVVARENARPGTADWQLTYVRPDGKTASYRTKLIEGYCSHTSRRPGETIAFHLSADPATSVAIDIYRMGYYQGFGGRFMMRIGPIPLTPQPVPTARDNRLRECAWPVTAELKIPGDWISGVYLGKLSCADHRYQSYVVFIVRDDRKADLLFQCSDNTWQAYNKWPAGDSLYDTDPPNHPLNGTTRVSFDRPYGMYPQVVDQPLSMGSGEFLCWEFPLCFWLERHGYDVTYISNHDTHADAAGLKRGRVFLSVGHDEYWSREMFDHVKAAVKYGMSAAFLSGNTCCFLAPLVQSSDGRAARVFHRAGRYGGLLEAEKEQMGPFDVDGLPNENTLIGARTVSPFNGSGDWAVAPSQAGHWIFAGTGIQEGDRIPGLVGWEFHGDPAKIPGLQVVATSRTSNGKDKQATFTATVYPGATGNWVFNAGTIFWSMGLSAPPGVIPPHSHYGRPHGPDDRVGRITENFLRKCGVVVRHT